MKKTTFLFVFLTVFFSINNIAQNTCNTAVAVTSGATITTTIVDGSGGAEMSFVNDDDASDAAWYSYTPASSGTIIVSSCGGGSDTNLYIGTGTCGALMIVSSDDDTCDLGNGDEWASQVGANVIAGTTYFIEWNDQWEDGVEFTWTLTFSFTPPPGNDECADAIAVNCGDTVQGNTDTATNSGGNSDLSKDLWYSYTGSGSIEDITVSLCNSEYDTVLRVYSDCSINNGTQILFNDEADCGGSSGTFTSDGTTTYYILVEGFEFDSGAFELTLTCGPHVPAPPNDLCVNAEALTLNVVTEGTTAGATDDSTGELDGTTCDTYNLKTDVWYTFVAVGTDVGIATYVTGTSDQVHFAVYTSLDCTQLNDDSILCVYGGGSYGLTVTPNDTYYVRVWSDGVVARSSEARRTEGTFDIMVSDDSLSTNDFENANACTYFPNPVKNELTLKAQSAIQNVSVYNMLGQEVLRIAPNSLISEVDMASLQTGAYFVKVTINDATETIRVIKQ